MNKKITFHKVENYPGSDNRFRFRVYDKEEKKYVSLCFHATLHNSFLEVGDWQIIEQCTGLKDKNGKLIFEGDVVEQKFKDGTSMDREVYYNSVLCRWYLRKSYPNLRTKPSCMFWDFTDSITKKLEIIGNVHDMEVE